MATMYKFPNRKKMKTKKCGIEEVLDEIKRAKPREFVVLSYNHDESISFFGDGMSQAAILWLLQLAQQALLDGELRGTGPE